MPFLDKVGEKLQKKSNHQQADMHTVHIGIGCDNHLIIPEPLDTVLYIKGSLQQVELLVLINDLLGQSVSIQRLTPQREDRLRLHITNLGNRTARRVPLGNENTALVLPIAFGIVVVYAAITQLAVIQIRFLRTFPCQLRNPRYRFAFLFRCQYLFQHHIGHFAVFMQIIIQFLFQEIADKLCDGRSIGSHVFRTELGLGLRLEYRFFHLDTDCRYHTVTNIGIFEILGIKLLNRTGSRFSESSQVRSSLRRMLPVHKRIIFLAILVAVRDNHLYIRSRQMNDRI